MAKKKEQKEHFEVVEETLTKTERFIEDNQQMITFVVVALVLVVAGYVAYYRYIALPNERDAQSQMFVAERYFERDSFNLALNGDGNYLGMLSIIDEYSGTESANLAHYYAGISYLNMGEYQKAIDYLSDFDSDDMMVGPIALGAMGDAYAELGNNTEAIKYYLRATNKAENNFVSPFYLKKAGLLYEKENQFAEALEVYERIQKEYNTSNEARMIEKFITRAKINR